tara:strand:- start:1197 stop:1775 length:579 start_codon:yes stop_codon:yes gene_type:complete
MIRIAVLGDIGSGKSFVANQFGYPVFNADNVVSQLYKKNKKCFKKLKKKLPKYIFSFPIKKNELTKAIMANTRNLNEIVKIVHPEVRKKMSRFIKKNKKKKVVVLDIPLLLENKINRKNDILVFVEAKKTEIRKRLKNRRNLKTEIVKKLKKLQLPLELKKKKSNFILKNNFRSQTSKKSVKNILREIFKNA